MRIESIGVYRLLVVVNGVAVSKAVTIVAVKQFGRRSPVGFAMVKPINITTAFMRKIIERYVYWLFLESNVFRAPAYKRADIGLSYRLLNNEGKQRKHIQLRNVWLGAECLNLFGINNVNSYYWITDVTGGQYAVPNYLTGRQINFRVTVDF